jgi:hypothetical protein
MTTATELLLEIPTGFDSETVIEWVESDDSNSASMILFERYQEEEDRYYVGICDTTPAATTDRPPVHQYRMLRFFRIGSKTVCSMDISTDSIADFAAKMFDKLTA